jgi:hypothetical protein
MSLRKAVLFLAAVGTLAAPAALAQAAVYGTLTVNQLSGIKDSPVASSFRAANIPVNDTVSPIGGTVGAYYDFFKLGPVKLGVDARGTITTTKRGAETQFNGGGARIYSGLGGIRAVFHTRFAPIRPYIQGSAGIARTDYGLTNTIVNNFQYEGFAGVDITLLPVMDFRLVEFGYGGINPMGTNGHNFPVKSVSSGLVFHLPF